MGDLLMSSPAIRALKHTFGCRITVLTSSMAAGMARFIPAIDEVITYDVPWVKTNAPTSPGTITEIVDVLKKKHFDAAVVFTVFSQNPLPAVLLMYMAGIPLRIAYCRENPYDLLTHWVQEEEPYTYIRHQVKRDLDLVKSIGASVNDDRIRVSIPPAIWQSVESRLMRDGFSLEKPWLILHPGVSEKKREYPIESWIETAKKLVKDLHVRIILTGTATEKHITDRIVEAVGKDIYSLSGELALGEFMALISHAPLVLCVNTVTAHIAAATHTPVIVLYALTNPQHAPWKVPGKVLLFDVPEEERSRNEILRYMREKYFPQGVPMVSPDKIVQEVSELLEQKDQSDLINEVVVPSDQ
jgi:ADP-heptose:LPS heptosyltransferase